MKPRVRLLLLAVGMFAATVLLVPLAHAITISKSAIANGKVKVVGKGAAPLATILWEGSVVTTANKAGKFNFSTTVLPSDCLGELSDGVTIIQVGIGRCTTTGAGGGAVAATGQTTCYDTSGNVIACAGTGEDGDVLAGTPLPSPRFTDNLDGTITDNLTGLIWLKNANCFGANRTWAQALNDANILADGTCGLTDGSSAGDWHLPNLRELYSLIHLGFSGPAVSNTAGTAGWTTNGDAFDNLASFHWSSTTKDVNPTEAWLVNLHDGGVVGATKIAAQRVFPVRSGP